MRWACPLVPPVYSNFLPTFPIRTHCPTGVFLIFQLEKTRKCGQLPRCCLPSGMMLDKRLKTVSLTQILIQRGFTFEYSCLTVLTQSIHGSQKLQTGDFRCTSVPSLLPGSMLPAHIHFLLILLSGGEGVPTNLGLDSGSE